MSTRIRALWILNSQDDVVFSRRFPVVEKRWRLACAKENDSSESAVLVPLLPTDSELASALAERKTKEGSAQGFGIRLSQSVNGCDSWIDDPIAHHIISLRVDRGEKEELMLWPLILHAKSGYYVLVLPLVEPLQLKSYEKLCRRTDCGGSVAEERNFSSLLFSLPCITGSFMVAQTIGDIITGDLVEPEVIASSYPSVGGLLDSLTGSIGITGISARAKPVAAPIAASTTSGALSVGNLSTDAPRSSLRPIDKDVLRSFISSSMPFGTPLDLSFANFSAIKNNGFSSSELPPADLKQPAWKPYLYKGRQRLMFTIHETINAAMYDRYEIPDVVSISGQINCRGDLEGLPDISLPLSGLKDSGVETSSFHHCVQVSEHGDDKQALMFSPPLGNFVLMRYQASCGFDPPVKGFYQLSLVSENEGAFLFKLRMMEGYKSPFTMEFCTVTIPFPRRGVGSFDGNPSIGTITTTEHSIEWKIIPSGRGITGKNIEATFSGTIKFLPWISQKSSRAKAGSRNLVEEDTDVEYDASINSVNIEDQLLDKMNKDLQAVDLEEPFCWHAYNYAKVSFKILGGTLSGMSLDPKSVNIYPAVKAPVELSMQASSGDYILWNTLGRCPSAASFRAH